MDSLEVALISGCVIALAILLWRRPGRSPLAQILPRGAVQPLHRVRRGRVYVRGLARTQASTLRGPFTDEPVLAYRVLVERRDGQHHWTVMLDHSEAVDFELVGEGVTAEVTATGALLILGREIRPSRKPGDPFPPAVRDLLVRLCQYAPADHDASRFRWSEFHVGDGDELHIIAEASVVPARDGRQTLGGGAYRGTPAALALRGTPSQPLVIFDQDRESLLGLLALPQGGRMIPRR